MLSEITIVKNKTAYFFCAFTILSLLIAGVLLYAHTQRLPETYDARHIVAELKEENPDVFAAIRDSLKDIVTTYGVQAAIDVNEYAFVNNMIGIYHCHIISHLTGHEAVVYYGNDYDAVINHDTHFCELGYRHGAEAQVALSGGNYKNNLYRMCETIKRKNPYADCFHGAGHAFMNESLDVQTSLELCDDLINETYTEEVVTPCYNAVFAELTNLVGGRDGGTGTSYTGGPPLTIEAESPLAYCSQFEKRYALQCIFEFSGLGIGESSTSDDIEKKLKGCSNQDYKLEYEAACIKSVAAVGTQHELAHSTTIAVPPYVFELEPMLRKAYISGAGMEMFQYVQSGAQRDWQAFCNTFTHQEDLNHCVSIFTG